MSIVLHSTDCPKCRILKSRLKETSISFDENNDVEIMVEKGFAMAPVLEIGGVAYGYKEAIEWIKEQKNG